MASTDQQTRDAPGRLGDERAAPDSPTDLKARSWRGVMSRTVREFKEDNVTVWAAALTYYGILAIFPAIIALVSILGLIGPSATQPLLDNVSQVAPGPGQGHPHEHHPEPAEQPRLGRRHVLRGHRAGAVVRLGLRRRRSCRPPTRSTTSRRDVRSGRRVPVRLGVTVALVILLRPSPRWPSSSPARWPSRPATSSAWAAPR